MYSISHCRCWWAGQSDKPSLLGGKKEEAKGPARPAGEPSSGFATKKQGTSASGSNRQTGAETLPTCDQTGRQERQLGSGVKLRDGTMGAFAMERVCSIGRKRKDGMRRVVCSLGRMGMDDESATQGAQLPTRMRQSTVWTSMEQQQNSKHFQSR